MDGKPANAMHQEDVEGGDASTDLQNGLLQSAAAASTRFEHELTLRGALEIHPKAIFFCFILSLAIIMEGYDIALIPGLWAQPEFREKYGRLLQNDTYQLDSRWQSALTGAVQCGSLLGYYISGVIIDRIGYKKTLIGCLTAITGFVFIIFFAPTVVTLVIGEGLLGIPWGIIQTLTTTYAADVSPIVLRPYLTSYINLCWAIGQLVCAGVLRGTLDLSNEWAFRIPFALQWVWPIPIMIAVAFAPDSPWWLVRRGRIPDAKKALLRLSNQKNPAYDVDAAIARIRVTIEAERAVGSGAGWRSCFKGANLRRTEIACIAGAVPFFSGYNFASQGVYFLSSAGLNSTSSYNVGIGQSSLGMVGVIASWFLVHRFGRRTMYLTGYTALAVLLFLIGILGILKPTVGAGPLWATGGMMILFVGVFSAFLGPLAYVVVSEVPSSELRNKTVAAARVFLNIGNFGASWLTPALINPSAWDLRGKGAFAWLVPCLACLIWAYFRLPETKDRTFGELDDLFHRGVKTREFGKAVANVAIENFHEMAETPSSKRELPVSRAGSILY